MKCDVGWCIGMSDMHCNGEIQRHWCFGMKSWTCRAFSRQCVYLVHARSITDPTSSPRSTDSMAKPASVLALIHTKAVLAPADDMAYVGLDAGLSEKKGRQRVLQYGSKELAEVHLGTLTAIA